LTPRVRTIVLCDDVSASLTEDRVFTLQGVRFEFVMPHLPIRKRLCLFLALSSARKGVFPGYIVVINERTEKSLRYLKLVAEFQEDNQLLPYAIELGDCDFPNDGFYRFEVYFSIRGAEALKGEHSLEIIAEED